MKRADFIRHWRRSGLKNPGKPNIFVKKNVKNHSYHQFHPVLAKIRINRGLLLSVVMTKQYDRDWAWWNSKALSFGLLLKWRHASGNKHLQKRTAFIFLRHAGVLSIVIKRVRKKSVLYPVVSLKFFKNRFSHSTTQLKTGSLIISLSTRGKACWLARYKCEGWELCCQLWYGQARESYFSNFLSCFHLKVSIRSMGDVPKWVQSKKM